MKEKAPSTAPPAAILLVDDNRHGCVARRTLLEEQGYKTTIAHNGEEALEAFGSARFDLVVTDYRMPRMNGGELIQSLREQRPQVPIILLSGFVDAMGLDEKSTGADIVIPKGANEVTHLKRAVERLLRNIPRKPAASQGRGPAARAASAKAR